MDDPLHDAPDGDAARLYETYSRGVFAACLAMLGSHDDAADATHEVFAKALPVLREVRHPNAWLQTAARHHCADVVRRRRLAERRGVPDWGEGRDTPDPADVVVRRNQLMVAVASLSDREREALLRAAVCDAPVAEIARRMRLSYAATVQLLARARRRAAQAGNLPATVAMPHVRRLGALLRSAGGPAPVATAGGALPRGVAGGMVAVCVSALCLGPGGRGVGPVRGAATAPAAPPSAARAEPRLPALPASARLPLDVTVPGSLQHGPVPSVIRRALVPSRPVCAPVPGTLSSTPTVVWTEPANDPDGQGEPGLPSVSGVTGGFNPAVDLVEGVVTADFATSTLRVRVYVQDMSLSVPNGAASMTYATGWAINTNQEQVAYVRVDSSGTVSYYDFNSLVPDAGSYVLGPGGYVEVDVPFAHYGIHPGSVLPGLNTETSMQYTYAGSEGMDNSPMPGDTFTVGAPC